MSDGMFNMESFNDGSQQNGHPDDNTDISNLVDKINDNGDENGANDNPAETDLDKNNDQGANNGQDDQGEASKEAEKNANPPAVTAAADEATLAKIKESGYDSLEALIEAAKKPAAEALKPEPTPEELERSKQVQRADFINYAIKESKLSDEYIKKVETLMAAPPADVVYNSWKEDYMKSNTDADEDDVRYAFENQYNINSNDEGLKKAGAELLELQKERLISKEAAQYNQAVADFNDVNIIQQEKPVFEKLMNDTFSEIVMDLEIGAGDEKTNFKSTITKDQVLKAVGDEFGKDFLYNLFNAHLDGQKDMVKKVLSAVGKLIHKDLIFDAAIISHGETMRSLGTKGGALGSKSPFNKNADTVHAGSSNEDRSGLAGTFS